MHIARKMERVRSKFESELKYFRSTELGEKVITGMNARNDQHFIIWSSFVQFDERKGWTIRTHVQLRHGT